MRDRLSLKSLLLALVACGGLAVPALAEEPAVDPVADKLLRNMGNYLRVAEKFTFAIDAIDEDVLESGQKLQFEVTHRVAFRRPDQFNAVTDGDLGVSRVFYNGVRFSMLHSVQDSGELEYCSVKVPGTTDECFEQLGEEYGIVLPLGELLHSDPYALLSKDIQSATYVGTAKVRGTLCHHLAFTSENADFQIWVEAGWQPVPRKVVITDKQEPGMPQTIAYLYDWNFNPYLPDSSFSFWVPPSAQRIPLERLQPGEGSEEGSK